MDGQGRNRLLGYGLLPDGVPGGAGELRLLGGGLAGRVGFEVLAHDGDGLGERTLECPVESFPCLGEECDGPGGGLDLVGSEVVQVWSERHLAGGVYA